MSKSLPTKADFGADEAGWALDAHWAWQEFGGLTLDEAYEKFCENPLYHDEDFMFMGEPAFAYYFPVLDRYVREIIETFDEEGFEYLMHVWYTIKCHFAEPFDDEDWKEQFRQRDLADGGKLRQKVIGLSEYVLQAIPRLYLGSKPYSTVTEEGATLVWRGLLNVAKGA